MTIDAATAELFSALAQAGARARLLKGPSIAGWLYDDPDEREYGDCDVLIAPESVADAERALEALGYEREYDDRALPDWWREHASAWLRHRDGVSVDLHRTLVGIGVPDGECWRLLSADPRTSIVGNRQLPALEGLDAGQLTLAEPRPCLGVRRQGDVGPTAGGALAHARGVARASNLPRVP